MGARVDIFIIGHRDNVEVRFSKYGADASLDLCCKLIENGIDDCYPKHDAPMADCYAEAACIIDFTQNKAWIWSWELVTNSWEHWQHVGKETFFVFGLDAIRIRCHDQVPRLWDFYLLKSYRGIYNLLKNANKWTWPEPKWEDFKDAKEDD